MCLSSVIELQGCIRLGNPDLDFENLNLDFPIKREIRKRISPPRNPSSGWISIKKSKSGFFGFPFLSFDWEIQKRIWKTVLRSSGIACTRIISKKKTAIHENSFANSFSDFPIERQKGKSKKFGFGFLNIEIHPEDRFLRGEIRFWISHSIGKSGFPNRTHSKTYCQSQLIGCSRTGTYKQLKHILTHSLLEISPKNAFWS